VNFFFSLLADGRLDMAPLVSRVRPYTEAPQLYSMLLEDRSRDMGVIMEWQGGTE
jgi:hypothetical protein